MSLVIDSIMNWDREQVSVRISDSFLIVKRIFLCRPIEWRTHVLCNRKSRLISRLLITSRRAFERNELPRVYAIRHILPCITVSIRYWQKVNEELIPVHCYAILIYIFNLTNFQIFIDYRQLTFSARQESRMHSEVWLLHPSIPNRELSSVWL